MGSKGKGNEKSAVGKLQQPSIMNYFKKSKKATVDPKFKYGFAISNRFDLLSSSDDDENDEVVDLLSSIDDDENDEVVESKNRKRKFGPSTDGPKTKEAKRIHVPPWSEAIETTMEECRVKAYDRYD